MWRNVDNFQDSLLIRKIHFHIVCFLYDLSPLLLIIKKKKKKSSTKHNLKTTWLSIYFSKEKTKKKKTKRKKGFPLRKYFISLRYFRKFVLKLDIHTHSHTYTHRNTIFQTTMVCSNYKKKNEEEIVFQTFSGGYISTENDNDDDEVDNDDD